MQTCGNCQAILEDSVSQCPHCGRIFALVGSLPPPPTIGRWQAGVLGAAQSERANENAVRSGNNVNVPREYLDDLRSALSGVLSPSEQLGDK